MLSACASQLRPLGALFLTLLLVACSSAGSNLQRQDVAASTVLIEAAARGDLKQLRQLARQGVSLNARAPQGTALGVAAEAGQEQVVWFLLGEGADVELANADGRTPLMAAAAAGHRRVVQMLLAAGAQVNARNSAEETAVTLAARRGSLSTLKVLITGGGDVNVVQHGESLLMHVVRGGDLLTAESLVSAGADPGFQTTDGLTAIDIARAMRNRELEILLSRHQAP
ncbi:MAG: ankyrin repeat domain-containing protein [Marinobacter sp.]|nr:ankyrin repeat domain-containing protein [Marinobacter sp.]